MARIAWHEGEYSEFVFLVPVLLYFQKREQRVKVILDVGIRGGNVSDRG